MSLLLLFNDPDSFAYDAAGGVTAGGVATTTSTDNLPSYWGLECTTGTFIRKQFLQSGSNFKRRDYSGGGSAFLPAITICNQGLAPYFETNEEKPNG